MTDFEKAIRYLCLFETNDMEAMVGRDLVIQNIVLRYLAIQDIIQGDLEEEKNMQKNMKK